jgi:hypothetical protein
VGQPQGAARRPQAPGLDSLPQSHIITCHVLDQMPWLQKLSMIPGGISSSSYNSRLAAGAGESVLALAGSSSVMVVVVERLSGGAWSCRPCVGRWGGQACSVP